MGALKTSTSRISPFFPGPELEHRPFLHSGVSHILQGNGRVLDVDLHDNQPCKFFPAVPIVTTGSGICINNFPGLRINNEHHGIVDLEHVAVPFLVFFERFFCTPAFSDIPDKGKTVFPAIPPDIDRHDLDIDEPAILTTVAAGYKKGFFLSEVIEDRYRVFGSTAGSRS